MLRGDDARAEEALAEGTAYPPCATLATAFDLANGFAGAWRIHLNCTRGDFAASAGILTQCDSRSFFPRRRSMSAVSAGPPPPATAHSPSLGDFSEEARVILRWRPTTPGEAALRCHAGWHLDLADIQVLMDLRPASARGPG